MERETMQVIKQNDTFDVVKFVLSLCVASLHLVVLPSCLYPLFRMAVPLFFLMSSYFFFGNQKTKKNAQWMYMKRSICLYVFWLIAQLDHVFTIRQYHMDGFWSGLFRFLKNVLFGSTFRASWYLMAQVIAIILICWLSKQIKNEYILLIFSMIYVLCCIASNYYGFVEETKLGNIIDFYTYYIGKMYNSFWVALFWCFVGKIIAEKPVVIKLRRLFLLIVVSLMCLFLENMFIRKWECSNASDCYLLLPIVCISIFYLLKDYIKINCSVAKFLRGASTVIFVSHVSISTKVGAILYGELGHVPERLLYVVTIVSCLIVYTMLFFLSKLKCFRWLRYTF